MTSKICKHCNEEIFYEKHQQFGGHLTNCSKNPNKENVINKIKDKLKKKKVYNLNCLKCECEYTIEITEHKYNQNDYKKYCSYKCSNSRVWNDEDKKKKSISALNSEKVLNANNDLKKIEKLKDIARLKNVTVSDASRKNISEKVKAYYINNPTAREKQRLRMLGTKLSEETKKKLSDSRKEYYKKYPEKHPNG